MSKRKYLQNTYLIKDVCLEYIKDFRNLIEENKPPFFKCVRDMVAQTAKRLPAVQETGFDPWVGKIPWRRKWQPTPGLLPGKFHGLRSQVGYSPWGRKESDTTERLHFHFLSAFFKVQLSHPYMTTGKSRALTRWTFVSKVMSQLFNMLSRLLITFLPRSKHLLIL